MTAREQLQLAQEMGHELRVETRGPWPEHGDPNPKYVIACTCGWRSTARRSRSAANGAMAWHLGRAIADAVDSRRQVGDRQG
jgi:hypothetical protein